MKKILFFSFLSLSVMMAKAQSHSPVSFGVKGGFNVANLRYADETNPDSKLSGNVGLLAHIHVARQFAIQPELVFSGQGAKETVDGKDYKWALNYLNIPVLAQAMFGHGWRVETGPQAGILVSAKSKVDGNSADIKDNFKTFDFAWVVGLGYLTHSGLGIDARYNIGLSSINDATSEHINNRVWQFGVFYQFSK